MLLALSALSKEIDDLVVQANTTFYNPLLFYGEGFGNDTIDDGEAAKAISRVLPTLQHVNMNQLLLSYISVKEFILFCLMLIYIDIGDGIRPTLFRSDVQWTFTIGRTLF